MMKNKQDAKHTSSEQGMPTSDRMHHNAKDDKKQQGVTNGGGQRSDQTSNKDNQRKHENR